MGPSRSMRGEYEPAIAGNEIFNGFFPIFHAHYNGSSNADRGFWLQQRITGSLAEDTQKNEHKGVNKMIATDTIPKETATTWPNYTFEAALAASEHVNWRVEDL